MRKLLPIKQKPVNSIPTNPGGIVDVHLRCRSRIKYPDGNVKDYKFINEAKRASVLIQRANGGLGRGAVKVVPKLHT